MKKNIDDFAIEAMKVLLSHQGVKEITPLSRIKRWLGFDGWKQTNNYDFKNIAQKSYELASIMCKESEGYVELTNNATNGADSHQ